MANTFRDTIPTELVTHVMAICGTQGEQWFDDLPKQMAGLESAWAIIVHAPFPGIEYNYVAPATAADGTEVVMKIAPPFETVEIYGEAKHLRTVGGQGSVKLLAEDRNRRTIMIERALPGEALFERFKNDAAACIEPAIEVLRSILRPTPADMSDVVTLDQWFNNFRRYAETKFPAEYARKAFEIDERLSKKLGSTFYLHGDFHPGNVVTATRSPFLAIDPKGIVGHVGYEIAVFLNNLHWWQKGMTDVCEFLRAAVGQFAAAFDFEEQELREWAYAGMVIGAWWIFDDMPDLFNNEVALADIWDV